MIRADVFFDYLLTKLEETRRESQVDAMPTAQKAPSFKIGWERFLWKTHKKLSRHPKVPCWDEWVRLFLSLRLLLPLW